MLSQSDARFLAGFFPRVAFKSDVPLATTSKGVQTIVCERGFAEDFTPNTPSFHLILALLLIKQLSAAVQQVGDLDASYQVVEECRCHSSEASTLVSWEAGRRRMHRSS
ncbi:uncharacterized protein LOC116602174 [Nematostella vectensis]|uniref:uncharacterized protein LOC116602174 n=1 Tax=Nematostella vectensis TaxID=45351 RepID=UPI0020778DDF|nr:uncharacterized protein LOC116602174 [Nematostella vectensis]